MLYNVCCKGVFFFDNRYRPVPLDQYYIGVTEKNSVKRRAAMNKICYEKVLKRVKEGHQVHIYYLY